MRKHLVGELRRFQTEADGMAIALPIGITESLGNYHAFEWKNILVPSRYDQR